MQVDLHTTAGATTTWVTGDAGWTVLNADVWLQPAIRSKVCYYPGCGAGSGTGRVEHTDVGTRQQWRSFILL